jgi:hypothetical protein
LPKILRLCTGRENIDCTRSTVTRSTNMPASVETSAESEPPSSTVSDDSLTMAMVERVMAISHLPATAHVTVIGHHTLPFVLALLRRGCGGVRSLRPGSPAPDREVADLAWIVDLQNQHELADALRAARWRVGDRGRIFLEGRACRWPNAVAGLSSQALAIGLDIVAVDHKSRRVVLAPMSLLARAA